MINPYLYKMRPYPLKILVDIHSFCNARCTMCPYPKYSRQQTQGFMDWQLYKDIIDEFAQLGHQYNYTPILSFCYMGEVFLSQDLPKYIEHAIKQDISVYFNTNAYEMTPEKLDGVFETGFQGEFMISSHSHNPEVYKRIMGLDYERTLNNILYLLDRYDPKKVLIRGVDDNWPEGEKEKWFEFWEPKGVQIEYLEPVSRCGGVKRLLPENLKHDQSVRLYGCKNHLPLHEMIVLYDGRVVMCCQDMGREVIWGNVRDEGVAGVWNGKTRTDIVKRLYNGSPNSKDFICSKCEYALGKSEMVQDAVKAAWRKIKPKEKQVPVEI